MGINSRSIAFRFFSQVIVGLAGLGLIVAIGIYAHFAGVRRQLYEAPLKVGITVEGKGDELRIESTRACYSTGKYFVYEIGTARIAIEGRAMGHMTEAGSSRPVWFAKKDRYAPRANRGWSESRHPSGTYREESWSIGPTLTQRLWDDIEFTITDGVLTIDGHHFNILDRPRLITLDADGSFLSAEDLPPALGPKNHLEIGRAVKELAAP